MNHYLVQLGRRIKQLRAEKSWSQEEFAQISGLHRTFVAHVEGGKKNLSFDSLMTIATHLGVSLEQLVTGIEYEEIAAKGEREGRRHQQVLPPELQRILTQLRGQRAGLDRTISALEQFGHSQGRDTSPAPRKRSGSARKK